MGLGVRTILRVLGGTLCFRLAENSANVLVVFRIVVAAGGGNSPYVRFKIMCCQPIVEIALRGGGNGFKEVPAEVVGKVLLPRRLILSLYSIRLRSVCEHSHSAWVGWTGSPAVKSQITSFF